MKMTRHAMTLALAGGLLAAPAAGLHAQEPGEDLQARAWAATCATCHGTNGKGPANDGIPALAGQTRQVLLEKLLAFKQGSLPATVMHQHAKGYSDEELARIAAFFARQSR